MKKTVAIVGSHDGTRDLAPFDNQNVDIWVFNEAASNGWAKRVSAVFQMHDPIIWRNPANRNDPKHYDWLRSRHDCDIWMQEQYADIPSSRAYPLDEICDSLTPNLKRGNERIKHFTSSIAYALALAIYKGYERMEVYGIELETNTEYTYQRDTFYFWTGLAVGRGMEVVLHTKKLFDGLLYGFEGDVVIESSEFEARRNAKADEQKTQLEAFAGAQEAARTKLRYLQQGNGSKDGNELAREYVEAVGNLIHAAFSFGTADGAMQENDRYLQKIAIMKEQSGDFLFSRQEFEQSAAMLLQLREQAAADANFAGGEARTVFSLIGTTPVTDMVTRARLAKVYGEKLTDYINKHIAYGQYHGAYIENSFYLSRLDELIKAAGGKKSEAVMIAALTGA